MKDVVWLHIGPHKTGSSAIQKALQDYDDGTTRVARLGRPNHSIALTAAFKIDLTQSLIFTRMGIDAEAAGKLRAETLNRLVEELAGPAARLVLSAEAVSNFTAADFEALTSFLMPFTRDIRVLAYARAPIDMLSSLVQQRIRSGRTEALPDDYLYRSRFGSAVQVLGAEKVQVGRFDPASFVGRSLIRDVYNRLQLTASPPEDQLVHAGLSRAALAVLLDWNASEGAAQGSPERVRARNRVINLLGATFPGRFRLSPDIVRGLVQKPDLEWLFQTFGIDFRDNCQSETRDGDLRSLDDFKADLREVESKVVELAQGYGLDLGDASAASALTALYRMFQAQPRAPR